jgi:ParB family chromosome partitioning protein
MAKPALGRGLGALLGGNPPLTQPAPVPSLPPPVIAVTSAPDNRERVQRVALNKIRPSVLQPRKQFSEESLRELADSIREQGIVQPLIVREHCRRSSRTLCAMGGFPSVTRKLFSV